MLPDIRSFHFCRFLCCTPVWFITVRTAKFFDCSSSSYTPRWFTWKPLHYFLTWSYSLLSTICSTCSLVQWLSCTIVHKFFKNGTNFFRVKNKWFLCCHSEVHNNRDSRNTIPCPYGHGNILYLRTCTIEKLQMFTVILMLKYLFCVTYTCVVMINQRALFSRSPIFLWKTFAAVNFRAKTISTVSTVHFPNRARQNRGF